MADKSKQGWDWLTILGLVLTVAVIAIACWVVNAKGGITALIGMDLNNLGDFLAGFAGALALIWLVIAFFQQGELLKQNTKSIDIQQQELQNNNEILKLQHEELRASSEALRLQYNEMKKAAEQAAKQSEAIAANELHARRDTFFRQSEMYEVHMSHIAWRILEHLFGFQHTLKVDLWNRFGNGDKFSIISTLSKECHELSESDLVHEFKITPFNLYAKEYCQIYMSLLSSADQCDSSGKLRDIYENCPFGDAYSIVCFAIGDSTEFVHRKNEIS